MVYHFLDNNSPKSIAEVFTPEPAAPENHMDILIVRWHNKVKRLSVAATITKRFSKTMRKLTSCNYAILL